MENGVGEYGGVGTYIMKDKILENGKSVSQKVGLILGPVLFFVVLAFDFDPQNPALTRMAAVAILMAVWWITDAIPLFATSLLPMILFPFLDIMKGGATAPIYFNSTIFLFLGGFMIALTMEKWSLHRRIAFILIKFIGGGSNKIILSFMIASAFLSMWISNTATAIIMVPIGLSIISKMEENFTEGQVANFSTSLMLSIAYACSLGGMATLVGTPPNLAFSQIFQITFPHAEPIGFGTWFLMGLPISIVMIVIVWFLLTRVFFRVSSQVTVDKSVVNKEYKKLGLMTFEEKTVLIVFILTAFLWVFRKDLNLGIIAIPGWSHLLPYPDLIDDATIALFMAMLLFIIPTKSKGAKYSTIAGPDVIRKLPWDIVLLFGGGFALAKGFQVSGLSIFIGTKFGALAGMPPIIMIVLICFGITFLTELTSNTATTQMILPILASVAVAMNINPLLLMIPATLSASCAFMLPVATPPNAIVFGSGRIKISEMTRVGVFINIIGIIIITLMFYFIGTEVLGIDFNSFPEWAK